MLARALALVVALLHVACSVHEGSNQPTPSDAGTQQTASGPGAPPAELPGIEHYRRWSVHLGQGSQPQGDASFAALAAQGFTTVLSVDGSMPDVEGAARHGLRYVHVPIGYDGIDREERLQIVKAASASDGPVFVHCHHGLHRGPAAAAIARIATDGVTADVAYLGLKQSGCSPDYAGLYRDVAAFVPPSAAEVAALAAPPSRVRPDGIRASMVAVDEIWGVLKNCRIADWKAPVGHPDVQPAHEALMLQEQLRELARIEPARQHGDAFVQQLSRSASLAGKLSKLLGADADAAAVDAVYVALKQSCASCHADYRD
jgi:protein tyrosine phosphatase (PTP) superfamily phosphohydrolase (DUF442 family)